MDKITAINPPKNAEKFQDFLTKKEKNLKLISGLLGGNIQTKITTHLPYIVHKSTLSMTFSWQGISIKSKLTPTFLQPESLVSSNIRNQPISPSRWQAGITKVELEFQCLIDYDAWTPSLLELGSEPLPFDGWAKGFTLAFKLLTISFGEFVLNMEENLNGFQHPEIFLHQLLRYYLTVNE